MGVGKTTFTRYLTSALGSADDVSSPTFALVHRYRGPVPVCHYDMYRIHTFDGLYSTGFFDDLESGAVLVVEWSENVAGFLPEGGVRIDIRRTGETDREITVEGGPFG